MKLTLNNGVKMPATGLGVFQTPPDETRTAVEAALDVGYRHIDTAAADQTRQGVRQLYSQVEVTADDVAEVIGFVLSRPRHLVINEVLLRPAGQL